MQALITGGAGFIGSNLALKLVAQGWKVIIFDNLSRKGTKDNLKELVRGSCKKINVVIDDVREYSKIKKVIGVDVVFHLAAQTAVTTSLVNPKDDFEINIGGTLNVLEAIRSQKRKIPLIYSSTNKVYGALGNYFYKKGKLRYDFKDLTKGINEKEPLDFYSPYGCSKGAADSYCRDFWRVYNIPTVVFRQSCIYGARQLGVEDQGWVAYLGARALQKKPINIFGDGKQVRDLLYIDDLTDAYLRAISKIDKTQGQVFNIGGGLNNSLSVLEYIKYLENHLGIKLTVGYKKEREGDQKVFISDNSKLKRVLNWQPSISYQKGLLKMLNWISEKEYLFAGL